VIGDRRKEIADRCDQIADEVVPAYRCGKRSYGCTGTVAKRWGAAWDAACLALGGNPESYRRSAMRQLRKGGR
jgi:hypothetical protein